MLRRLEYKNLQQVNPLKSYWCQSRVEFLGFLIARDGIKPQVKKNQGILTIKEPRSANQLLGFVGMINYYKSLWHQRSNIMAPLTAINGKGATFKWTKAHSAAFKEVKNMVAQDTMLTIPTTKKDLNCIRMQVNYRSEE